ncbi:MAG: CAAX prenyl protease-related protein [Planctomycetia bacterium]
MRHLVCYFSGPNEDGSQDAPTDSGELDSTNSASLLARIWQNPWLVFLLPIIVYMVLGEFEPRASDEGLYVYYPWFYTVRIALTLVTIMLVWPGYRQFPLKVSWLSVGVGVVGVVLWVALAKLEQGHSVLGMIGFSGFGERAAFNPFEAYESNPAAIASFLGIRFFGLAIVVPVIEEFFLRGFIMRLFVERDWWKVAIGTATPAAIVAVTVVGMLEHPNELLAAAVWFSLVTWLVIRTKSIWDCVVAHMVTNFLLGIYVILSGDWFLW